jgi:membrane protein required for colicin V production
VIDIVIILLILLLSWKGFFNGVMRELVGFVGLIGGIFVASRAAEPVAHTIGGMIHMGNPALLKLLGFLLVLGLIWGGSAFVGTIFSALKAPSHSTGSKLLGMAVAGFKYFLIFSLISASLLNSALVRDNFAGNLNKSRLLPTLNRVGSSLINMAPLSFKKVTKHG